MDTEEWVVYRDKYTMSLMECYQSAWEKWVESNKRDPEHIHADRYELVAERLTYEQVTQMVRLSKE